MTFLYLLISIACALLLYLSESIVVFKDWATSVAIITFLHASISVYIVKRKCTRWICLPVLFLFGLFLFNYGQLWLLGFVREFKSEMPYNKISIYPQDVYITTCILVLGFITFVTLGVIKQSYNAYNAVRFKENFSAKSIRKIGCLVLLFTLPFNIYENSMYFIASAIYGYREIYTLEIPNYISALSWITLIGFVCLLMGSPNKKHWVLLSSLLFYGAEMLAGNRGHSMMAILTILLFYNLFYPVKMGVKRGLIYFVGAFLVLTLLSTIKTFRGYTNKNLTSFIYEWTEASKGNILYENLEEFGGAIAFPSIYQIYLRQTGNYLYGRTYVVAFVGIIPNIGIIDVGKITKSGNTVQIVQEHGIYGPYESISASVVSEALLNFGFCGTLVFAFVLGSLIGFIHKKIEKKKMDIDILYYVMACYGIIYWTRGGFSPIVRFVVWGGIIIYISKYMTKSIINSHRIAK